MSILPSLDDPKWQRIQKRSKARPIDDLSIRLFKDGGLGISPAAVRALDAGWIEVYVSPEDSQIALVPRAEGEHDNAYKLHGEPEQTTRVKYLGCGRAIEAAGLVTPERIDKWFAAESQDGFLLIDLNAEPVGEA